METKFNFKSQICTSRSQSERLMALGIQTETADVTIHCEFGDTYILGINYCQYVESHRRNGHKEEFFKHTLPAWSLGRLWELYWSNKVVSDCLFGCGKYMNPYAKMIAMIEYDIEDGTFNKDYLDK